MEKEETPTIDNMKSDTEELSWMDKRKAQLEELNVQLHLGRAEAKDAYQNQKVELRQWVDSASTTLDEWKQKGGEKTEEAQRALEELRVQAALAKAESRDALHKEQKELSHKLHDVKQKMDQSYASVKSEASGLKDDVSYKLEDLKTRFDLFRLQTSLGAMDAGDAWEERKKVIAQDLHEMKQKLEHGKDVAADRLDTFSSEMSEAWTHFKSAFKS